MGRFLSGLSPQPPIMPLTAPLIGSIEYHADDTVTAIAVMHRYVSNQGTLWDYTQDYLDRLLTLCVEQPECLDDPETHAVYRAQMAQLGRRTAELHGALASGGDPHFDPEPLTPEELASQLDGLRGRLACALGQLRDPGDPLQALPEALFEALGERVARLSEQPGRALAWLAVPPGAPLYKLRIHGNYHLGQVLIAHNEFVITDFEGDPDRPLEERRGRYSLLKDVAGMHYSLAFACAMALQRHRVTPAHELQEHAARAWEQMARDAFMAGYRERIADCAVYPVQADQARALLDLQLAERALDTLEMALHAHSTWLEPAAGILLELLEGEHANRPAAGD
jgi:maltose alpha-D-glucosyltransferase/alpha-amylase